MKLRVPSYYKEFVCIADRCKDSCCIGWEIDIDEDTYEYYQSIEGEFGDRLRSNMKSSEDPSFRLKHRRCPFLTKNNLCDICIHLGEEALSEVCTEYPRFTLEYGNVIEKCMALSCEEVGRIIFESDQSFEYEELLKEDSYCYGWEEIINCSPFEDSTQEYEEDTTQDMNTTYINTMEETREIIFLIVKTRSLSIEKRMQYYLYFCDEIQQLLNMKEYDRILSICNECKENVVEFCSKYDNCIGNSLHALSDQEYYKERWDLIDDLEVLDHEWRDYLRLMRDTFIDCKITPHLYEKSTRKFIEYIRPREYEYEHLLNYFTFRYFMRSVYDYNLLNKAKLAIVSVLYIRDMDVVRFLKNNENYTLNDRIDIARIYSKEIEHSDDNIDAMFELFTFEDIFSTDQLSNQCIIS